MPGFVLQDGSEQLEHGIVATDGATFHEAAETPVQRKISCHIVGGLAVGLGLLCVGVVMSLTESPAPAARGTTAPQSDIDPGQYAMYSRILEERAGGNRTQASAFDASVSNKVSMADADSRSVTIEFQSKEELRSWSHDKFEKLVAQRGIMHWEWRVVDGRDGHGQVLSNAPDIEGITFPYNVTFHFKRRVVVPLGATKAVESKSCPTGSIKVGEGADVAGCGLEECKERHYVEHIEACKNKCRATTKCKAFTWLAADVQGRPVCTLFATDKPDQPSKQSTGQIMCKLQSCFKHGVRYGPSDMAGQAATTEHTAYECQARCQVTAGCAHFSYRADQTCHLQDAFSQEGEGPTDTLSGPPMCEKCGIAC